MSDLSEKLDGIRARAKAYAEHGTPGLAAPRDRADLLAIVDAQQAALAKVESLHQPLGAVMYAQGNRQHMVKVCTGCGQDDGNWQRWPCPTVRALGGKA